MLIKELKRLRAASGYSFEGLIAAWRHEAAFRLASVVLLAAASITPLLPVSWREKILLIGVWVAVVIVELINSALEAVVDRISLERHELSKRAKDYGSAAVLLTALLAIAVWVVVLIP